MVLERVAGFTSRYNMFAPHDRVGVAVSGGADSVCLLHILRELPYQLELHVLHVNHMLRGPESEEDARFVAELAAGLGLPFHLEAARPIATGTLEEQARRQRLAFFRAMRAAHGLSKIATGHTQSDQAETVLFRLLRGTGSTGLRGVRPNTREGVVRPLLAISREEAQAYLMEKGIPWQTDRTNRETRFTRNRLRLNLIPQLAAEYNPKIGKVLAQTAEVSHEEEAFWQEYLGPLESRLWQRQGEAIVLDCREFSGLHPAVQRRLMRNTIARVKATGAQVDFVHVEAAIALALGKRSSKLQIPGLDLVRSFDWLRFARQGVADPRHEIHPVNPPCELILPDGHMLKVSLVPCAGGQSGYNDGQAGTKKWVLLDWEKIGGPAWLRFWQPGDQYCPRGCTESKKLKEMFQIARIPLWERRHWPMIESSQGILWSRQFGPSAAVVPGVGSSQLLAIEEIRRLTESNVPVVASV
jgi:tRNA(Ile)-lysidine synthase